MERDQLIVLSGNANRALSQRIAHELDVQLGQVEVKPFADGETCVTIQDNVRGHDVFIIQPTCPPVNHNLMELLILIDACRRSSARRITAVVPYYGYARQDRKTRGREPISAKLVANLLTTAGARRVLTMDLHAGQIQGFFDIPVDNLEAVPVLAHYISQKRLANPVVVSPDLGGVTRARDLAERLQAGIAVVDKRRPAPDQLEVMNVIGEVKGKDAIIIDDIMNTGGTIAKAAQALVDRGASSVLAAATHGLFAGDAARRLADSPLSELMVTDTIPISAELPGLPLTVLSVAPLLGEAISCINRDQSVSHLFQ